MGKDIRQEAFNYLIDLANKQGYVTFDEIMDCADEHDLPIQDFDWLSNSITSRGILVYSESPSSASAVDDDEYDDFTVRNLAALMDTMMETANTITMLLGCIAAISLLVGGIGIMNIMLVSVTERTREIGIRKALGATYDNILLQFLIEAMVIGIVGGTLGVLLGVGASYAISYFAGWMTIISVPVILIAVLFSVGIGLFFGIYPARKAALLDPIEALRYE